MLTCCPECKTTFRLTQEQLGLRRGLVRCGRCKAVFNAYHTLLPDLLEPPASTPPASDLQPLPEEPVDTHLTLTMAADQLPVAEPTISLQLDQPATPVAGRPAVVMSVPTAEDLLLSELPTRVKPDAGGGWKTLFYATLSLLLLVLLSLQATYFLRADLAAALPELRPLLEQACRPLACKVPLPHQLDKRAIVSSSLEHDAERASHVRLTLLLANRSGKIQAWPQLILTLIDLHEAPVAIKTFPPSAYLPSGLKEDTGMAAGSEVEVRLELELGKLVAAGYSLDLVYPQ